MKSESYKNLSPVLIAITLVIGFAIGTLYFSRTERALGDNAFQSTMPSNATSTARVAVSTNTRILATTTTGLRRVYTRICNTSSTVVYLNMNNDKKASLTAGFPLFGTSCFDINSQNLYQGAITASSTNQTSVNLHVNSWEL